MILADENENQVRTEKRGEKWASRKFLLNTEDLAKDSMYVGKIFEPSRSPGSTREGGGSAIHLMQERVAREKRCSGTSGHSYKH